MRPRTARVYFAALAFILTALLSLVVVPPSSATLAEEAQFVQLLNDYRATKGLGPLESVPLIAGLSRSHSQLMADNSAIMPPGDALQHANPIHEGLPDGYWIGVAENIGFASHRADTVGALHAGFVASSGHEANMVGVNYDAVGVGVVSTGAHMWVTFRFVDRPGVPAPTLNPPTSTTTTTTTTTTTAPTTTTTTTAPTTTTTTTAPTTTTTTTAPTTTTTTTATTTTQAPTSTTKAASSSAASGASSGKETAGQNSVQDSAEDPEDSASTQSDSIQSNSTQADLDPAAVNKPRPSVQTGAGDQNAVITPGAEAESDLGPRAELSRQDDVNPSDDRWILAISVLSALTALIGSVALIFRTQP